MRIIADVGVLVRAALRDDIPECQIARKWLTEASVVAVPLPTMCEFFWVLRQGVKLSTEDISIAIRALMAAGNVVMNRPAVAAGLALLDAGGDFVDGIMAHEGRWLGGEILVSFDVKAVSLQSKLGHPTRLLSQ